MYQQITSASCHVNNSRICSTFFYIIDYISTVLIFFHNMDGKLDPVEEEAEEVVAEVHLNPPPKERKSKKANKDRAKKIVSGKDSMAPPQKRSRTNAFNPHNFADVMTQPENTPGPTTSSSATYPGENQLPIPVINDLREYGDCGYDAYNQSWQFFRDYERPRRFDPYYEGRRYEENAAVPYANHPSGPYTSDLSNMAP
jgi:hypothetical protein